MPLSHYHHGDLRAALLRAGMELLEQEGSKDLSLRAVARRAGVSPGAPYRHYADREALISAIAAIGYRELAADMAAAQPAPETADEFAEVGVVYVEFALRRPALFRVMFGAPCDRDSSERVAATSAISEYLTANVQRCFPLADVESTTTAIWGLVHGLAFLHLDGKLSTDTAATVSERVRLAIGAILTLNDRESPRPSAHDR
ncbi:TetR/AcrR family transcriptional regulator [Mycolicibacterium sp. CH28]|uniref:TetR/AcrR family transcriptional regulator n=1 Tax=Mycolicibacterium sp. CH28 TaxID=2512237 RepID=UPI0010820790|nr:TetR/AcrR family transcriptional regulator [Mycolicibacterium sp. CH28]TGD89027.1 TetR/AcrR family transcriptional regulator [Mycolicibacterium sp. CH28]